MQPPILTEVKPLMLRAFFTITTTITTTLNIAPTIITITITITNKHERNGAVCALCVRARIPLLSISPSAHLKPSALLCALLKEKTVFLPSFLAKAP